jgi:hypothetical protein
VRVDNDTDDEESAPGFGGDGQDERGRTSRPKWGSRGISVSADDGVYEHEPLNSGGRENDDESIDPDAKMQDPDDLAKVLDDDEDSPLAGPHSAVNGEASGVHGGDEWDS